MPHHPLPDTLAVAVPLWILRLHERGGVTPEDFRRIAIELDPILERADALLLYRGKEAKKGEIAQAFNKLAEGIAILSFVPGGIRIFGSHYCAENYKILASPQPKSFSPTIQVRQSPKGFTPNVQVKKALKAKPPQIKKSLTPEIVIARIETAFGPSLPLLTPEQPTNTTTD